MSLPSPTEKQARVIWFAITGLAFAVIVALIVALVWGLGKVVDVMSPVIWPLAVAGVLACLLDPVVDFLVKRNMPRARAISAVFALALLIVFGLAASVIPQLVIQSKQLAEKTSEFANRLPARATELAANPPKWLPDQGKKILESVSNALNTSSTNSISLALPEKSPTVAASEKPAIESGSLNSVFNYFERLLPQLTGWLNKIMSFVATVFGIIAGLALVPIYAFYFLLEKHGINKSWRDYLPIHDSRFKDEAVFVISAINEYIVAFFRGQVLVAICDGVLYTIGFLIIGLDYAILLGVMATCLTIIPFLGAITTCVVGLAVAFLPPDGGWEKAAMVLAVFAVVQTLEGFVIQPRIMGERVGLHPVTIIIALMVGTTLLGGILGGILAIPLAAVLRVLMTRYVWRKAPAN